jgi:phosphoribosylformylglycinamidine synthase
MKIRVDVMLKEGVLDPQGKAVEKSLASMGFKGAENIRIGKVITLDLAANTEAEAKEAAKEMAEKLLANLVIEDYRVTVLG